MQTDPGDVVVAIAEGVLLLDVAGPVQVLHWAGHRIRFASPDGAPVHTDVGAPLGAERAIDDLAARADTRIAPGYAVGEALSPDPVRVGWRVPNWRNGFRASPHSRMPSICVTDGSSPRRA
ncbi:hypothetical protein ABZ540_16460 [Nocardia xishanensis]|uniref:hypothetical protein n=1 Tax=Nocardia xishanensis TaxID=238964 RepID=UPI0033FB10F2